MPSSQLKRAERSIAAIREQAELSPGTADAIEEIVAAIRTVERRLEMLEKGQLLLASEKHSTKPSG